MYSEYNLYKVFEYIFGILFFVSIRVFILNTFKKYFTQACDYPRKVLPPGKNILGLSYPSVRIY
jgi:hypothetical protein